ncbi:MAG TPA: 4-(cytidine 5'-diphospho)-2-C-methyl-D-erythritol kinase [Phycisphaerae bacterium]|nr:4-(cytidine 5'-diphospho)-2-C-methyl-D-erythritol kinase [Phycisphaerae bacterium]
MTDAMLSPGAGLADPPAMHALAPAKVNLRLEVKGPRSDGYHDLRSLAVAVGLFDELRFSAAPSGSLELTCSDPSLPCDEKNLIVRAARLLAERTGTDRGARIDLIKGIGIGAGLGGGSSDAAATLQALNRMWQSDVGQDKLAAWAADIGSDVPLFFSLPTAVMWGRGEKTRPVRMSWSGWVVLVFGDVPVFTAEVYRAWKPEDSQPGRGDEIERMIETSSAAAIMELAVNDLQPAVFRVSPTTERLYVRVRDMGLPVRVSGAGSTLFALFDKHQAADEAVAELRSAGLHCTSVGAGDAAVANPNDGQRDD